MFKAGRHPFSECSSQREEGQRRDCGNSRSPLGADGGGEKSWVQEYSCPYLDYFGRINRDLSEIENSNNNRVDLIKKIKGGFLK